jgi:Heat induced stress protein YflT domain
MPDVNAHRQDPESRSPARRPIASYDNYTDAQAAVDSLSDQGFPVERVSIVGRDLEFVEQVTGRLNYGRAALRGAGNGAFIGALFGWIFGILDWVDPLIAGLWLALYGAVLGALIGALLGLLFHLATGGKRDFSAIEGMRANHYEVLVDAEVADEAERLLGHVSPASTNRPSAAGRGSVA